MNKNTLLTIILVLISICGIAKDLATNSVLSNPGYWQQHVDYTMEIDMNVENYQYKGTQHLVYTNNSPDVLQKVFYHLYFNAFQPGSEMDIRLQEIADPDRRMVDKLGIMSNTSYESRIAKLQPNEMGYIHVLTLKQNGESVQYKIEGTVLEVTLNKALLPGEKVIFDMKFEGQVPVQIRRSGRNNKGGVALSMTQWYPKMAEYDFEGWHAHPYISREFQGVWGNFDVTIHIDKDYVVGGTGYLQNPQEIGHGYEDKTKPIRKNKEKKLIWNFVASNVHDFAWAADPDYLHDILKMKDGPELHFFYKKSLNRKSLKSWKKLPEKTAQMMRYYGEHIGKYPYKQYSVIQGGDGGMEYAMCTLVTGKRSYGSLVGVTAHELAHSWFQQILATNESKHPWMDEGFTEYISSLCMNEIMQYDKDPKAALYQGYTKLVHSGMQEPLSTQADRYHTNFAYGNASYDMGGLFLFQLGYIIGEANLKSTLNKYFEDFKFKHPTPNDIKRTAEKISDMHLDWFLNEWTQTTHTIDYTVAEVAKNTITLARIGRIPMPLDIKVTYIDGSSEMFYISLRMMRGEKPTTATVLKDWAWAYPTYSFETKKEIIEVEIDPLGGMADINRENNKFRK